MRPLSSLREGWEEVATEEDKIDRAPTVEESVRIFLSLMTTYSPLMDQTRGIFQQEREEYLTTLQQRLNKLRV